jgi:hypothetical protein
VSYGLPQLLSRQWRKARGFAFRSPGVTLRGDASTPIFVETTTRYRGAVASVAFANGRSLSPAATINFPFVI